MSGFKIDGKTGRGVGANKALPDHTGGGGKSYKNVLIGGGFLVGAGALLTIIGMFSSASNDDTQPPAAPERVITTAAPTDFGRTSPLNVDATGAGITNPTAQHGANGVTYTAQTTGKPFVCVAGSYERLVDRHNTLNSTGASFRASQLKDQFGASNIYFEDITDEAGTPLMRVNVALQSDDCSVIPQDGPSRPWRNRDYNLAGAVSYEQILSQ